MQVLSSEKVLELMHPGATLKIMMAHFGVWRCFRAQVNMISRTKRREHTFM